MELLERKGNVSLDMNMERRLGLTLEKSPRNNKGGWRQNGIGLAAVNEGFASVSGEEKKKQIMVKLSTKVNPYSHPPLAVVDGLHSRVDMRMEPF